jgi:hypothetical protein
MKQQLLALAYKQEDEFGSSERDEFDCLIALMKTAPSTLLKNLLSKELKNERTNKRT